MTKRARSRGTTSGKTRGKRVAARPAVRRAARVRAVPGGFHTVTASLTVKGAAEAIDFYKRAFGARELMRMPAPDGRRVMHAELRIGDSIVFVVDEFPDMVPEAGPCPLSPAARGGPTSSLHLYVADVDRAFARAVAAGATARMAVMDMFWGDRFGQVVDPFGHFWGLATHKEDLTPRKLGQRALQFFAQVPPGGS